MARWHGDHEATHHCWLYLLADGRTPSSDDLPRLVCQLAGAPHRLEVTGSPTAQVVEALLAGG